MPVNWAQKVRAFLAAALLPGTLVTFFLFLLRHVVLSTSTLTNTTANSTNNTILARLARFPSFIMASLRRDSKIADPSLPVKRHMVHLKTKEECRLDNETIQVWTVELPSKHAEGILKVIKDNIEGHDSVDLQHLRRFAKPKFLPAHVLGQRDLVKEMFAVPRTWDSMPPAMMQVPSTTVWEYSNPGKKRNNGRPATLHLLICPSRVVDLQRLHKVLSEHPPFCSSADSWAYPLEVKQITVPLLAPTSPAQADKWSEEYWPTFYRKTNPFGAHPTSIEKAELELQQASDGNVSIDEVLALAERAGDEARHRDLGAGTGCAIVERVDGHTQIVAVAGDARYRPLANGVPNDLAEGECRGNVMGHAIMRAVGMIGRKRLRVASKQTSKAAAKAESNFSKGGLQHDTNARDAFFLDLPITPVEEEYFFQDNLKPDGYLCLKLEIFLTHEPCMMCSMALVHSRVGRVVFKNRMPKTGGLTAELVRNDSGPVGLGYGLCWRKELNWQFMCWEYMPFSGEEPTKRQGLSKSSSEKYHEATVPDIAKRANVTHDSFARMHV